MWSPLFFGFYLKHFWLQAGRFALGMAASSKFPRDDDGQKAHGIYDNSVKSLFFWRGLPHSGLLWLISQQVVQQVLNAAALRRAKALSLAPAAPVAPKSAPAVKRKKDKVTKERVNILYIICEVFFLGAWS